MTQREIEVLRKIYDVLAFQEASFFPNYPKSRLLTEFELIIKQEDKRADIRTR